MRQILQTRAIFEVKNISKNTEYLKSMCFVCLHVITAINHKLDSFMIILGAVESKTLEHLHFTR